LENVQEVFLFAHFIGIDWEKSAATVDARAILPSHNAEDIIDDLNFREFERS
jgi:hypothetical protein